MEDKNSVTELSFEEIIKKNEKKLEKASDVEVSNSFEKIINKTDNEKNNKIVEFNFDEIVKKKAKEVSNKSFSKKITKKQKAKIFKYKNYIFKNLVDLKQFFLLEYKNREEHATILLNNQEFLDWITEKIDDKNLFTSWVENVLS